MHRTVIATLEGISPYSMSRAHESEKLSKETPDAYEERTWKERGHYTPDGHVFIPPMAFKFGLAKAAKNLGLQIPGKGKATYTKFFENGIQVIEGPILDDTRDTVRKQRVHAHSNGVRGSGKRVWRYFPVVDNWSATVEYHVLADEIVPDVFAQVLEHSGLFVGIGQFRPENGGTNGRFAVRKIEWNLAPGVSKKAA